MCKNNLYQMSRNENNNVEKASIYKNLLTTQRNKTI